MNTLPLDRWAEEAELRYGDLEQALQGLYNVMVNDVGNGSVSPAQAMNRAYSVVQRFLSREHEEIERCFATVVQSAQGALLSKIATPAYEDTTDALSAHLRDAGDHLLAEIAAQIERDLINMRKSLSLSVLEIAAIARSRKIQTHVAIIHYKLARREELKFTFRDRRGRVTAAGKFIRAIWRHALIMLRNEVVLITLTAHGFSRVMVMKLVDDEPQIQMEISIAGEPGIASYRDVLPMHFHPNSNAWLDLYHV